MRGKNSGDEGVNLLRKCPPHIIFRATDASGNKIFIRPDLIGCIEVICGGGTHTTITHAP